MIWESHFWKNDLLKKAATLRKRKTQQRWPEASQARVEQTLMIGFYSIRKLQEAAKLSTTTLAASIPLVTYKWSGKIVTKLNWSWFDELYHLDAPQSEMRDALFICHQFVHSFVFSLTFDECDQLQGVMFASDHQRHIALLHISIDDVINLFETVGNDYPNHYTFTQNQKTKDYDVLSKMVANTADA